MGIIHLQLTLCRFYSMSTVVRMETFNILRRTIEIGANFYHFLAIFFIEFLAFA